MVRRVSLGQFFFFECVLPDQSPSQGMREGIRRAQGAWCGVRPRCPSAVGGKAKIVELRGSLCTWHVDSAILSGSSPCNQWRPVLLPVHVRAPRSRPSSPSRSSGATPEPPSASESQSGGVVLRSGPGSGPRPSRSGGVPCLMSILRQILCPGRLYITLQVHRSELGLGALGVSAPYV